LDAFKDRYELIGDVRGIGPMLAMELVKDRDSKLPAADEAKTWVGACRDKGLLLLSCGSYGNVVRLLMPLVVTDEQLERGLAILEDGLAGLKK